MRRLVANKQWRCVLNMESKELGVAIDALDERIELLGMEIEVIGEHIKALGLKIQKLQDGMTE